VILRSPRLTQRINIISGQLVYANRVSLAVRILVFQDAIKFDSKYQHFDRVSKRRKRDLKRKGKFRWVLPEV
jgi:hypothetical protein